MATSGSLNFGYYAGSSEYYFTLYWNIKSQSIANNTTTISYSIVSSWPSSKYIYVYSCGANINGTSVWGGESGNVYGQVTMASGSLTIKHGSDGKKTFSASGNATIYSASNYNSNSNSWALTTIPRQATISTAPNFNDEGNPEITYANPAGSNVTTLQAGIFNTAGNVTYVAYRNINKTGTLAYTFNLTDAERTELRNAMPNSNSLQVRFYIKTVIGGTTFYSSLEKTCTIINGTPIFNDYTYEDINQVTKTVTGNNQVLIKGLSILKAKISAANKMQAIKSSTEKNYIFSIDKINKTVNYSNNDIETEIGVINSVGNLNLDVRAYDSRNNSKLISKSIPVYDYDVPKINLSVVRLNNWENTSYLNVDGTFSQLNINGINKNTIKSVKYRYREENGTWQAWSNLNFSINNNKFICQEVILNLNNSKAFEFELQVQDNLVTQPAKSILDIGQAIFFISSNLKTCLLNGKELLDYEILEEWEDE